MAEHTGLRNFTLHIPSGLVDAIHQGGLGGRGKTQVTLDFCNPAVRDSLFEQLDAVYSSVSSLAYVKWDCNANIWNPGSPYLAADRQANLWYDCAKGYLKPTGDSLRFFTAINDRMCQYHR